jgi:hypothetical protein
MLVQPFADGAVQPAADEAGASGRWFVAAASALSRALAVLPTGAPLRRAAVIAAAVVGALVAGGCTGEPADGRSATTTSRGTDPSASGPSDVRWGGDSEFGVRITVAGTGQRWSEGLVLCVTGPTAAQVTGVRFAKGSGVTIHRYAVRLVDPDRSDYLGSEPGTLTSLRFTSTRGRPATEVSARCGAEGLHSELGVEISLASGQAARVSDLRVQYQSLSHRGEESIPFELQLCVRGAREAFCR